jgi:hypothetical protein
MNLFSKLAVLAALISVPASATTTHALLAPGAKTGKFTVMYTSLIPYAPLAKKCAMLLVDEGQRVHMRQYLGLPIDVRITPDSMKGIYDVQILRENGPEITESRQGFLQEGGFSTAGFIDQRIEVSFGVTKRMLANPSKMVVQ